MICTLGTTTKKRKPFTENFRYKFSSAHPIIMHNPRAGDFYDFSLGFFSDICELEMRTGPCRASIRRFYFDVDAQSCQAFTYGGCRGNKNNFATLQACQHRCQVLADGPVTGKYWTNFTRRMVIKSISGIYSWKPWWPAKVMFLYLKTLIAWKWKLLFWIGKWKHLALHIILYASKTTIKFRKLFFFVTGLRTSKSFFFGLKIYISSDSLLLCLIARPKAFSSE